MEEWRGDPFLNGRGELLLEPFGHDDGHVQLLGKGLQTCRHVDLPHGLFPPQASCDTLAAEAAFTTLTSELATSVHQ